ncbi:MAG: CBS domain-containing protein, partial [Bryobacteraceae bacterium]
MKIASLIAAILLAPWLVIISFVQLLYLESLRLRTRDLPALEFFKEKLEDALGMKSECGLLSFSLIKHSSLLLLMLAAVGAAVGGRPLGWLGLLEAALASWIGLVVTIYLIPHILYRRTSASWLLPLVPILRAAAICVRPLVLFFEFLQSLVASDAEQSNPEEPPTPAENIEALIEAGAEEGLIEEDDRRLIQSVVEFGAKTVREVMTPRPNMIAISADASLEGLRQLVINEQYSRIPVYEESIDNIVGFVHVRDM